MREFRPYGSVRGARNDARPYRDHIDTFAYNTYKSARRYSVGKF